MHIGREGGEEKKLGLVKKLRLAHVYASHFFLIGVLRRNSLCNEDERKKMRRKGSFLRVGIILGVGVGTDLHRGPLREEG